MANVIKSFFSPPLTGRHVLLMILGFFGVIFAVNAVFIYYANTTWRGLDHDDAYMAGLAYNQTLDAAAAQKALGWTTELTLAPAADGVYQLTVSVTDAAGNPVSGLQGAADLRRPADPSLDRTVAFTAGDAGRYHAALGQPQKGQWQVQITFETPSQQPFRIERRIIVE